ncbi:hypothetical protein QQ045_020663 [Rhodiola kirilowii]
MAENSWTACSPENGPAFITQCPIRPGGAYTYRFTIENQEGTLWWHAHSRWLRATIYGALIIYPIVGTTYPFPAPKAEFPVLLDTIRIPVQTGQTVLLRIVNAALNQELFFSVANHRLTVVGADAEYTKPFTTNVIEVGPGQTTDVLMTRGGSSWVLGGPRTPLKFECKFLFE